jgi:hypothetical protein
MSARSTGGADELRRWGDAMPVDCTLEEMGRFTLFDDFP